MANNTNLNLVYYMQNNYNKSKKQNKINKKVH